MICFDPGDIGKITLPWDDVLPEGVTLSGVVHSVDAGLTKVAESNSTTTSTVQVSGGVHGQRYNVSGKATLSNGEVINRGEPALCFRQSVVGS